MKAIQRERFFFTTDAHGLRQNAPRENVAQMNAAVQSSSRSLSFLFHQESLKPFPRQRTAARDFEIMHQRFDVPAPIQYTLKGRSKFILEYKLSDLRGHCCWQIS